MVRMELEKRQRCGEIFVNRGPKLRELGPTVLPEHRPEANGSTYESRLGTRSNMIATVGVSLPCEETKVSIRALVSRWSKQRTHKAVIHTLKAYRPHYSLLRRAWQMISIPY